MTEAYHHLTEIDGANFVQNLDGTWITRNKDGITIVRGALSIAEAARLYCEDQPLTPDMPDGIWNSIFAAYRSPSFLSAY